MIKAIPTKWVYILAFIFIAINSLLIYFEFFWFSLFPAALALAFLSVFALDKILWFIVLATPLSFSLENLEIGGIGMFVPTEPLMFLTMIIFFIRLISDQKFDKKILLHPITLAIFLNFAWITVTAFTSEMLAISFKFVLARMWFIVCCYLLMTQLFRKLENTDKYLWLYIIPLTLVIIYTFTNHAIHNFEEKPAHWVMQPFFKDHTSYGAIVIMFFPMLLYFLTKKLHLAVKFFTILTILIFIIGAIFSYTRAAWVSFALALVVMLIYKLKIKFSVLAGTAIVAIFILVNSWNALVMKLEKNRQDSSGDLSEHVQSISNISSDASNLERINRWECAIEMFKERPIFGWGPGTYMFQYAPFQRSSSLTIISTNNADNGNAHSEFIGPLAESGLLGSLTFILIVVLVYYYGSRIYHQLPVGNTKNLLLFLMGGFTTYIAHGFLNNYLDTDKASVPFWGFVAIIVAIDVYHKKRLMEADTK